MDEHIADTETAQAILQAFSRIEEKLIVGAGLAVADVRELQYDGRVSDYAAAILAAVARDATILFAATLMRCARDTLRELVSETIALQMTRELAPRLEDEEQATSRLYKDMQCIESGIDPLLTGRG